MTYTFYFGTREDAARFYEVVYDIAMKYGTVRLSDLYDLKGEPSDYLANTVVWGKDSVVFDMHFDQYKGMYLVVLPEPDQYLASDKVSYKHCECRTTWRNTGKSKKTPEPLSITIVMDPSKDPYTTIREVIQQANEIKDRPVYITIN